MDAWSALFIVASSVSLAGLLTSCAGHPSGRVIREREIVQKGVEKTLSELNDEIVRLEEAAAHAGADGRQEIWEEIGRLDDMKADLLMKGEQLRDIPQEEWNHIRDETLESLSEARRFLRKEGPGPALHHV